MVRNIVKLTKPAKRLKKIVIVEPEVVTKLRYCLLNIVY